MKTKITIAVIAVAATLGLARRAGAQTIYDTNNIVVQTFAGSGLTGYLDGIGTQTMWAYPTTITADSLGNLFVWDNGNHVIRKITPDSTVSTFAGGGTEFSGYGTNVNLNFGGFNMVTIDHSNTIWTTIYFNNATYLLSIGPDSHVSIENGGLPGLYINGGMCVDSHNYIYYAGGDRKIYRYFPTNGVWEVFVGSGNSGLLDGNGIFTSFGSLGAMATDQADNIYVQDSGMIRRINQNRDVVTIAGNGGGDGHGLSANALASSMWSDNSGNLILANGSTIRKMSAATNFNTLAGTPAYPYSGYTNGPGRTALFNGANSVCVSKGNIYVADSGNQRIRSLTYNPTNLLVLPLNLQLDSYPGLRITGTVGRTYRVESSPDTINWTTSTTLLLTSSPYLWFDPNPISGNKFYRAFLLP